MERTAWRTVRAVRGARRTRRLCRPRRTRNPPHQYVALVIETNTKTREPSGVGAFIAFTTTTTHHSALGHSGFDTCLVTYLNYCAAPH